MWVVPLVPAKTGVTTVAQLFRGCLKKIGAAKYGRPFHR